MTCLQAMEPKLYHMGLRSGVSRSTIADANESRDWRIYADFAQHLIHEARQLYAKEDLGLDLKNTVYALDSTTIDLCLSLFPWANFRKTKSAVKIHTLLDLRGSIPSFIRITDGSVHDVNILDEIIPEPGAFYVMDRGYLDFSRLYSIAQHQAFFVTRAKHNTRLRRLYSHPVEKDTGVQCDQTVVLSNFYAAADYPEKLRRVRYFDEELEKRLVFLTNNFILPAHTIALLYKSRWQVELFFKWIKQHLHIKSFFGTSENAVKVQIWTAVSVYVLIAIIRKRLNISISLYSMLQIFSISIFEKTPIYQLLTGTQHADIVPDSCKQLNLFDI
jgi:transposase